MQQERTVLSPAKQLALMLQLCTVGTPIHVFAFVGEMTKDQAVKIAAILKE